MNRPIKEHAQWMRLRNGADIPPALFPAWWKRIAQPLIEEARRTEEWRRASRETRAAWREQAEWIEAPKAMPRSLGTIPVAVARDLVRRVRHGQRWWRYGQPNPAERGAHAD